MELKPRCYDKIVQLVEKGVDIPNPLTLDIGEEVNTDLISGDGVRIYPGCRIYGEDTVISAGCQIGYEGPATVEACQLGPKVELKQGYFKKSVFLEKANMSLGAHVREGCILEEEANGAHCVGLKQTILFPFVTLGSLINFCDCLMAGGTSRKDHGEVGSSYIHFNFTPDGDKTTPSIIGDVPRGVMLNRPPVFLGGQGGIVGPVRTGFGNVVAAGTILRTDILEDNKLVIGRAHRGRVIDFVPKSYLGLSRIVANNIIYLANLAALEQWYLHVRKRFFSTQEFGEHIHAGLLDKVSLAKKERIKRLEAMAGEMPHALEGDEKVRGTTAKMQFHDHIGQISRLFQSSAVAEKLADGRDRFLEALFTHYGNYDGGYIEIIQSLPDALSKEGTLWLDRVVEEFCNRVKIILPAMNLFK